MHSLLCSLSLLLLLQLQLAETPLNSNEVVCLEGGGADRVEGGEHTEV